MACFGVEKFSVCNLKSACFCKHQDTCTQALAHIRNSSIYAHFQRTGKIGQLI